MHRRTTAVLVSAAAIALAGTAAVARATDGFPPAMSAWLATHSDAGAPAANPPCAVCHSGGSTARGTVTTPFGLAMRARGLVASNNATVATALDALAAERTDSDGDGVIDVDELALGTDPNLAPGTNAAPPIQYGCVQVAPGRGTPFAIVAAACIAALAMVLARRGSRKRARARR